MSNSFHCCKFLSTPLSIKIKRLFPVCTSYFTWKKLQYFTQIFEINSLYAISFPKHVCSWKCQLNKDILCKFMNVGQRRRVDVNGAGTPVLMIVVKCQKCKIARSFFRQISRLEKVKSFIYFTMLLFNTLTHKKLKFIVWTIFNFNSLIFYPCGGIFHKLNWRTHKRTTQVLMWKNSATLFANSLCILFLYQIDDRQMKIIEYI